MICAKSDEGCLTVAESEVIRDRLLSFDELTPNVKAQSC